MPLDCLIESLHAKFGFLALTLGQIGRSNDADGNSGGFDEMRRLFYQIAQLLRVDQGAFFGGIFQIAGKNRPVDFEQMAAGLQVFLEKQR